MTVEQGLEPLIFLNINYSCGVEQRLQSEQE